MPPASQPFSKSSNKILAQLSRQDAGLLDAHLEHIDLPLRKRLESSNRKIEHVYFLENGIASVVAGSSGREIEVGIIGCEGVSGMAVIMGSDRSPLDCYMQVAGEGHCMKASNLRARMNDSASLRDTLLKFSYTFHIQTSHTALANGRSKIEDRLARWLLMASDRIPGKDLTVTHEFLSLMLGVRRPGVTLALQLLGHGGLIRAARGSIAIVDREGLERASNGSYGIAEAEYRRLLG